MRRLNTMVGGGLVHVSIDAGPDDRDDFEDDEVPCCMASAMRGPRACTCWREVHDLEQAEAVPGEPCARAKCCADCAYLPGSPEREDGYGPDLAELALDARGRFACHQGMRRVVAFRHPDGREIEAGPGDYAPTVVGNVAYKADGTPADLCAGWAAHRRAVEEATS